MSASRRRTALAVAMAALLGARPAAAESALAQNSDVAAAIAVLDAWLEAARVSKDEPGMSVAIVHDQEVVWAKGYGEADRARHVKATPETLYRIASVSKLFTATAILQLRDAGKLGLDDPVSKHLAWFGVASPDGRPITIRHLLTHTSGLPRELPLSYWNDLVFPSREEMVRLVGSTDAVFPPETEWKYSNLALAIAGEVVAAVAGEPYERYVPRRILDPLGLGATLVQPRPGAPGLAIGYRRRAPGLAREPEDFLDTRALAPAANFASSVLDLARLLALQMREGRAGGAQVLAGSTLREMHRPQWLRADWLSGQGLGFWLRRVKGQLLIGHDGAAPGFRSEVDFDPATKMGAIVLSNAYDADPRAYVDQAFAIVGPALARATEKPRLVPSPDPAWAKYVGTYSWKHADVQILILGGELFMIVPEATNPWDSKVRLAPVGLHTFKMMGGSGNGELLRFETGASGRVTRLVAGSYYRLRVPGEGETR
jgi:CubicO group peptidase (beta-lactamase class C family)